ncbi:MAG: DoxX family protein [Candidatus Taylorbacteria bacterium]|nr:DoxX family protein [Candidatus Taylorbacteria bacterium]
MLTRYKDVLLFAARLIIGGIFLSAGWMKVADMTMTVGYFGQMGLPAFVAYLVAYAEIAGGLAVILGLWIELASMGLFVIMVGASFYSYKGAAAMNIAVFQALMPVLAIISGLFGLMVSGAGKFAIPVGKKGGASVSA